jgi:multidrug efflux pump subunit AcrB
MSLAEFSLKRPFTVAAGILLVCLLAAGAVSRMAMDIFPEINIPVVAVVWSYAGMSAPEMRDRITPASATPWWCRLQPIASIQPRTSGRSP